MSRRHIMSVVALTSCALASAVMAADPIVYSGPNRNIVYSQHTYQPTISLFNAPGTWDDLRLDISVNENPGSEYRYTFQNLLSVHGNYVEYAVGTYVFDIKRFTYTQTIGPGLTYSGNSYKEFSNYDQHFDPPYTRENGEFRNQTGYAGLRLTDGTNTYYGWLQVAVTSYTNANITGTLIDWAYNSTPNSPIPAGVTNISPNVTIAHAVAVTWPTISNLVYQLQGSDSLTPPAWTNIGAQILGDGKETTQFAVATNAYHFYRCIWVAQ